MSMSHSREPLAGREVSFMHTVPLTKSDSVTVMVPGEKVAIATVCVWGGGGGDLDLKAEHTENHKVNETGSFLATQKVD